MAGVEIANSFSEVLVYPLDIRFTACRLTLCLEVLDQLRVNQLQKKYTQTVIIMRVSNAFFCIINFVLLACSNFSVQNQHLRRHCMHSASWDRGRSICQNLTQAKIDHSYSQLFVNENVSCLQIFVENIGFMKGVECNYDLDNNMAQ